MMTMLMKMMTRFTGSLDKGYHHTELMVYTCQRRGDISDSARFQCKHRDPDVMEQRELRQEDV